MCPSRTHVRVEWRRSIRSTNSIMALTGLTGPDPCWPCHKANCRYVATRRTTRQETGALCTPHCSTPHLRLCSACPQEHFSTAHCMRSCVPSTHEPPRCAQASLNPPRRTHTATAAPPTPSPAAPTTARSCPAAAAVTPHPPRTLTPPTPHSPVPPPVRQSPVTSSVSMATAPPAARRRCLSRGAH